MKTSIKLIVAAAAAIAVSSPALAAGYHCKGPFTSTGNTKLTKYGALKSAREVWAAQVRAQYGDKWDTWSAARGKSSACAKSGTIFNFTCKVTARPCR
jgi:hypothetical protein